MNRRLPALAVLLAAVLPAAGAERELVFKEAKKEQVRHSMIGPRDTVLFYTFSEKAAVLVVKVPGKIPPAATGAVHLFAPGTTAEELGKWVNNQHSDGLFPDVPEPVSSVKLPDGVLTVTLGVRAGQEKSPVGEEVFADHEAKLNVKEHRVAGEFRLTPFEDATALFVKIETS